MDSAHDEGTVLSNGNEFRGGNSSSEVGMSPNGSKEGHIRLRDLEIAPEILKLLPADFVKDRRVLPIETGDGWLRIGTARAGDDRLIDDVRLITGMEVEETEIPEEELIEKISECYRVTVEQMLENLHSGKDAGGDATNLHDIEVMANEPTVVNLVNVIISTALQERTSDIHIVPFEKTLQIKYRIDGLLHDQPPPPKQFHAALVSRIKIMADMNIAERFLPQDGHIQIHQRGKRVDIRVGTMPTIYGESMVLRLLEKGTKVQTPEELGLDPKRAKTLSHLVDKPHGLFLTTGPTGSGKTTTLYSILSGIYTPEKKILTIEDPVEYELHGVAQIPVRPSRGFTFATGLRAILRQDPDVVMVGEIRDTETAQIAIRAALTGHQVFSTLHTNDSAGAITRLVDMGVEPFLISSSLEGVLAQRLLRRICTDCRTEWKVPDPVREKLAMLGAGELQGNYFHGAGCDECRGTGYRGRVGIFELLTVRNELREMIVQRRSSGEIKAAAHRNMTSLQQDALSKAAEGVTSLEEVIRVTSGDASE